MRLGRDQGGIQRGDRADTGDLEAGHKDGVGPGGSGVRGGSVAATGHSTGNSDALGDEESFSSEGTPTLDGNGDLEDLTILDATDPTLGLTDIGDIPAQDWAADTGPTRTGEAGSHGVDRRLAEKDRGPGGRKIDFDTPTKK